MGNKPERDKPWQDVPAKPIADPDSGGGGVVVDTSEPLEWKVTLEDLTEGANALLSGVAVRVELGGGRLTVFTGEILIGFVSLRDSTKIRKRIGTGGGVLLGQVVKVDLPARKVVVLIRLEGR